jgi:hypothetical protein
LTRFLRRRLSAGDNRFAAAKEAFPVEHNNPSAAFAADLDIGSGADNSPFRGTAWMGFAGGDHITDQDLFNHGYRSNKNQLPII